MLLLGAVAASSALGAPCADVAAALSDLHIARMSIFAQRDGVSIGPSAGKGFGVFATRRLVAEATVGDYIGERLTQRDVDARYFKPTESVAEPADLAWFASRARRDVSCTGNYVFKVADDLFIDSEDPTTAAWTRYLNHGQPNLKVHVSLHDP